MLDGKAKIPVCNCLAGLQIIISGSIENWLYLLNVKSQIIVLFPGYPAMPRAQYQFPPAAAAAAAVAAGDHLPGTYTPSAAPTNTSVAFHSDPGVYGGSTSPLYAAISPHAQVAQYAPTSSQSVVSAPAYSR